MTPLLVGDMFDCSVKDPKVESHLGCVLSEERKALVWSGVCLSVCLSRLGTNRRVACMVLLRCRGGGETQRAATPASVRFSLLSDG